MMIIPAVDLKDGRCVRLSQGRMDHETVYSEDPVSIARHWESRGAERLHVVDLNGAVQGGPIHQSLIAEIIRSVRIPVEIGGGIRDLKTIDTYLSIGAHWVILGTAALSNRPMTDEACCRFPGRIILGIDARAGKVAIQGWNEEVPVEATDFAKEFEGKSLSAIIYTDIERDGTGRGLNLEGTKRLAQATTLPVIASGGFSRIEEIERVKELEPYGVVGTIIGRALYTEQIDLGEAIRVAKSPHRP